MAEQSHPFSALGTEPVPGESPAGINAKYEPDYELLEAELAKLESITSEKVDWETVKNLSSRLLSDTTKDFSVASYLAYALTETEGYAGMRAGLGILENMQKNFWENGFPPVKRLRGRKSAVEWLSEKSNNYMTQHPPANGDAENIVACADLLRSLDIELADKMESSAPDVREFNSSLKNAKKAAEFELKSKEPAPAAAPAASQPAETQPAQAAAQSASQPAAVQQTAPEQPAQAPDAQAPQQAAPQQAPQQVPQQAAPQSAPAQASSSAKSADAAISVEVGDLGSDSDAKKAYRQIQEGLRKLADFHAQQKPSDPRRYRYSRSALWDSIDKLPPNKDGKTQLPKPPADKLKKLSDLFEQGEFLEVVTQAESSAAKMPYWFDGTRLIVNSLEALGAEYQKAKDALLEELTGFINRVPKILELQYSDGTPFADDQTRFWLSTQMNQGGASGGTDAGDKLSEVTAEAEKLAASGKLQDALTLLNSDFNPLNERDKYRVKLASAELISAAGQTDVAIPLLQQLIERVEKTSVSEWESDFVARAYDILIKAYGRSDDENQDTEEGRSDAFKRLCWLDPVTATSL